VREENNSIATNAGTIIKIIMHKLNNCHHLLIRNQLVEETI
jgi:hypothetical protein